MANVYGTWTLFRRETKRFMKVYMQTIVSPVISNLLFLAIFGISLHRVVPIEGISYLQFLIPGLIIMGIINNAFQNPSSSIVIMKYQGVITDLMTIPLKSIELLIAITASAVFRGLIVGAVTLITGLFFVSYPSINIILVLIVSILVSLFFSLLGLIVGIWADEFDRVAFVLNFILMPLIFLGGVFYSISSLPEIFQTISAFNPIVYMIDLLRYGFIGFNTYPIITSILVITIITFFMGIASFYMLKKGYKLQT